MSPIYLCCIVESSPPQAIGKCVITRMEPSRPITPQRTPASPTTAFRDSCRGCIKVILACSYQVFFFGETCLQVASRSAAGRWRQRGPTRKNVPGPSFFFLTATPAVETYLNPVGLPSPCLEFQAMTSNKDILLRIFTCIHIGHVDESGYRELTLASARRAPLLR